MIREGVRTLTVARMFHRLFEVARYNRRGYVVIGTGRPASNEGVYAGLGSQLSGTTSCRRTTIGSDYRQRRGLNAELLGL